jgi:hypothetical protein
MSNSGLVSMQRSIVHPPPEGQGAYSPLAPQYFDHEFFTIQ